jgi:hypothetical protein
MTNEGNKNENIGLHESRTEIRLTCDERWNACTQLFRAESKAPPTVGGSPVTTESKEMKTARSLSFLIRKATESLFRPPSSLLLI